jgi:hypothetical protein
MRPSTAILLVGGAALLLYAYTKHAKLPRQALPSPVSSSSTSPGSTTAQTIDAIGTAAGKIIDSAGDLFID